MNTPPLVVICGRCKKPIPEDEAESCWFCMHALCYDCWDEHGHCGHKRADEMNEAARKVEQPKKETTEKTGIPPEYMAAMGAIEEFGKSLEAFGCVMEIASKGIDRFNKVWKEKQ